MLFIRTHYTLTQEEIITLVINSDNKHHLWCEVLKLFLFGLMNMYPTEQNRTEVLQRVVFGFNITVNEDFFPPTWWLWNSSGGLRNFCIIKVCCVRVQYAWLLLFFFFYVCVLWNYHWNICSRGYESQQIFLVSPWGYRVCHTPPVPACIPTLRNYG